MMPTPGAPRSCAQQANEHPNTASHSVQSDLAIVAPSRAGSCGEKQTTSTGTQDTQGPGTSTATGHSATSAPKLRYDGVKCWHPPKPGLKCISQVFKENYNKSWLSFDEADDDTRKIWWTEWRKQSLGRPSRMDEFFEHTHTRKEDRTQWVDEHSRMAKKTFQERMFQAEQERQAAIEAGVTDPPPVSEESIWIETVGGKRRGRIYGMGEVRNSSMMRPRVDGPTTTTSTDVLDLRKQMIILNREVEQYAAKYRELEDRYQREKREWQQTVESLREDLNINNSQMDQFSHQLSSLTEYVRAMGPSSSGSRVPPPPPFTFPSSQKSAAPGRKLPPILQPLGQSQGTHMEDNSDDLDDSDEDYLDEYE